MMRFPRSIRWRLQVWYGALLVTLLGGFGLTAFRLERARRLQRIDEGLQTRVAMIVNALRAAPAAGGATPALRLQPAQQALFGDEAGHYFTIWMRGPKPAAQSANAPADVPKPESGAPVVRTRGDLREVFLFAAPVDCALVGCSIAGEQADLRRLAALFTGVGAGVLALGLIGGWWLATRVIRPIEDISAVAVKIASGDLSQRINARETDSELGKLSTVLNSTFARLEASFAQQAQFTADAAHELRTPVSVMLTQTQSVLAREHPPAEYRETLEACQRAAQRMRRLIESMLELARLEAGQEALRHERCDLAPLAAECLEQVRALAGERRIELVADLDSAPCTGDPLRIAQVMTNFLTNALEHTRDRIEVQTKVENGSAVFSVTDNGNGVSPEDLPHLFERFYRGNRARSEGAQHHGLGLAISKAIAEAHGGTLEVGSQPGQGATFQLRLPESVR